MTDRAAFDAWDCAMRRKFGWRAGLSFWTRESGGGRVLIARHWPHKLCWDWAVYWMHNNGRRQFLIHRINVNGGGFQIYVMLWSRLLLVSRQGYGDTVAGDYKAVAPVVRYPWGGIGGGEIGRTIEERARFAEAD